MRPFHLTLWGLAVLLVGVFADTAQDIPTALRTEVLQTSGQCQTRSTQNARIKLHYNARTWDSSEYFENTLDAGPKTVTLGKGRLIQGLEEGVRGMCIGEVRRLFIPGHMAYGNIGIPGKVPPNTSLVYEVELVSVDSLLTDPWFWSGITCIISLYVYFDYMAKAVDTAKAVKFLGLRKTKPAC